MNGPLDDVKNTETVKISKKTSKISKNVPKFFYFFAFAGLTYEVVLSSRTAVVVLYIC